MSGSEEYLEIQNHNDLQIEHDYITNESNSI
jgi:hypothetical protein